MITGSGRRKERWRRSETDLLYSNFISQRNPNLFNH